ncbi:helix-turn-helix domain-containing protein [Bacillaceae bacterium SIJ1]|uniref:helix-turn-helix domain-containing protein n=1 Tax=Litoribacterium kuwaitense TaxID=1398745 RepID=UPI001BA7EE87|nr:helix-turn-helix domain-containing protein [Litoribacterium kuwaitense]NGP46913.1 helix-turn-helix domain-containing protein [Litoribacterium kuwaitense]
MSMRFDKGDMEYFCKLIYETIHIPVFYINKDLEVVTGFPATLETNPIYPTIYELLEQLDCFNDQCNIPVLRVTNFLENFISIKVVKNDKFHGTWMIGPSTFTEVEDETIFGIINDFQVKTRKDAVKKYYRSLPVINKLTLLHAGLLATYLMYSKRLSVSDVIQKNSFLNTKAWRDTDPDLLVSKSRQDISFHASYEWERAMFECIREGRIEGLTEKLSVNELDGKAGVLSKKSYLRNEKNLAIACITLATRYAMDGGLQPEIAYTMSDLYIQSIEEIKNVAEIQSFVNEALYDFANRVNKVKHHKYSKPINKCQSYIFKHLYEEITMVQLSTVVNMHQNYLSTLFKKEVGIPINEYIQKQKVEEAKKLLSHSDHSISEIYTWLNFHDQSHFTKVFKKYTGTTPKKYRMSPMGLDHRVAALVRHKDHNKNQFHN